MVVSLIDARYQRGSTRRLLIADSATSAVAAVALGVAATGTVGDVRRRIRWLPIGVDVELAA